MPRLLYRGNPLAYPGGVLPGFDPTHPAFSRYMFSGFAAQSGGFNYIAIPKPPSLGGTPTSVVDGALGAATFFTSANDNCNFSAFRGPASGSGATFAGIVRVSAITATSGFVINSNGGDGLGYNGTTGTIFLQGSGNNTNSSLSFVAGVPYFVALSWLNASTFSIVLLNLVTGQVESQSTTTTRSVAAAASTVMYVGNRSALARPFNGYIAAAMGSYNVFLSIPQMIAWAQNPWDFWYPPVVQDRIFMSLRKSSAAFKAAWAIGRNRISGGVAT